MQGDYTIFIKVHNFDTPTHTCPGCRHPDNPLGCCDYTPPVSNCSSVYEDCTVSRQSRECSRGTNRCDVYISYCLRALGSTANTDPRNISSCQYPELVTLPNTNGAELDFAEKRLLGYPNPIQYFGAGGWKVIY